MSRQAGLSLVGSSVFILYEGDTTVVSRDDDLKPANVSCSCLDSPALCAVKLFWLSVTLLLQESAAAPVVKLIDFENVSMNSSGACDESYLTGVRNLRWSVSWRGVPSSSSRTPLPSSRPSNTSAVAQFAKGLDTGERGLPKRRR